MAKYSKDLSTELKEKVENAVAKTDLEQIGIRVEAIRLNKSKNTFGEVIKGNDLVKLFNNGDDVVAIALYEDVFERLDEETQTMLIEGLVAQVSYDFEKDKLVITKPEMNISLGMYRNFGVNYVNKVEAALMTIEQVNEEKKEQKKSKK